MDVLFILQRGATIVDVLFICFLAWVS